VKDVSALNGNPPMEIFSRFLFLQRSDHIQPLKRSSERYFCLEWKSSDGNLFKVIFSFEIGSHPTFKKIE